MHSDNEYNVLVYDICDPSTAFFETQVFPKITMHAVKYSTKSFILPQHSVKSRSIAYICPEEFLLQLPTHQTLQVRVSHNISLPYFDIRIESVPENDRDNNHVFEAS